MAISFTHIINGVSEKENAELSKLQSLTLASFKKAKNYSEFPVQHLIAYHKDFPVNFGPDFDYAPPLERCITDLDISSSKKFPLLKDILVTAINHSNSEYIIYSNADIGLMLPFYNVIAGNIASGHDAMVINRRRVKSTLNKIEDLDKIYCEVGKEHLGFDMFVFKKDLYSKFILNNTCLGTPYVGNDLFYNLFTFAENPILLTNAHLTFHVGMELIKDWGTKDLSRHNYKEFRKTTKAVLPFMRIHKFPGSELGIFARHFKWLMNPTLSYTELCITDIKQLFTKRPNRKQYDPNYKKQSYFEWLLKKVNFD